MIEAKHMPQFVQRHAADVLQVAAARRPADVAAIRVPRLGGVENDVGFGALDDLGMEDETTATLKALLRKPTGLVLLTGPTGSGKTTVIYAALVHILERTGPSISLATVEDPVEFNLVGINQVQVRENIGLNFAAALRSFLRQDPNIILVGEIRDFETAEIAVKAA